MTPKSAASGRRGSQSELEGLVGDLTNQIPDLASQIRLLRMALDEFHTDFMWAVRNAGPDAPATSPFHLPSLPLHPIADSRERVLPAAATGSPASSGTSVVTPLDAAEAEEVVDRDKSNPTPTPVKTADEPPAEASPRHATQRKAAPPSQPLYMRIMQRHMTDVFRAIGYEELPVEDIHQRLDPLMETHGKDKVQAAASELIEPMHDRAGYYRLSAVARPFAPQLLGRSGDRKFPAALNPPPPVETDGVGSKEAGVDVTLPRNEVIKKFKAWLKETNRSFAPLTVEAVRGLKASNLFLPDGIVDGTELVTVRQMLSVRQRGDMASWLPLMGAQYEAVRTWPTSRGENNWNWMWEVVASLEEPE